MAFKLNIGLLALSLSLSLINLDGVSAGMATRYWDCCKPSASWGKKAPVYAPVDICKADGETLIDASTADSGQSGCNGGDQFMCNCMQPFDDSTDPTLALGFAAFTAGSEEATDCACYIAEFAHDAQDKPMKRNKLLFQVTNTGGDVQSENIDFQIPGGGLGAFTQGCPAQWKTPASQWGETKGGVKEASQCKNLPESLQAGCKWRFSSWGDNPVMKGSPKRVKCPKSLIDRSGCQRKDDNSVGAYQGQTDAQNMAAKAKHKRDRSVCLGGGSSSGSKGKPEGYGSEAGKSTGGDNGADSNPGLNPGSDSSAEDSQPRGYGTDGGDGSTDASSKSGDGSATPSPTSDGQPQVDGQNDGTSDANNGGAAVVPDGHKKMHKVCHKWR
ncbi:endoglucanase 1 (egl1) [Ustilago sp. UG-2017a]|nr:endoglucanase 1 (egl1) [Ustilago sp. UG-2017a]